MHTGSESRSSMHTPEQQQSGQKKQNPSRAVKVVRFFFVRLLLAAPFAYGPRASFAVHHIKRAQPTKSICKQSKHRSLCSFAARFLRRCSNKIRHLCLLGARWIRSANPIPSIGTAGPEPIRKLPSISVRRSREYAHLRLVSFAIRASLVRRCCRSSACVCSGALSFVSDRRVRLI